MSYLKWIALFFAIYGHGALAALPTSCEDDGESSTCKKCTTLNSEFEPPGVGEVWYSHCCTVSETTSTDPPVTTTKKYCFSYYLSGYPNNLYNGMKPVCSENGSGNNAWSLYGQCQTDSAADDPYTALTSIPACPRQHDSSTTYEVGDKVEDNGVVYRCSGSYQFCGIYGPDLRGIGALYWIPTASCTGTATPTQAPNFANMQNGCPEEIDSSTIYEEGDSVSVTRDDGISIIYTCKNWPGSQWCNVGTYSPLSTAIACNGDVCWPQAWIKQGACTGTFTPTATPTFDPNVGGCPQEYDVGTDYVEGNQISVSLGDDYGKIYQCKGWPSSGYCGQDIYSPLNNQKGCNGKVCWPQAWTYVGGCSGTITPTATPTFDPNVGGCPQEYENGAEYEEGDKVSVTVGDDFSKIYQCKGWPFTGYCGQDIYSPANAQKGCNGEVCWPTAWTYIGGCSGTITPTATPTFDPNVGGCPNEYENGAEYGEGDKVSVTVGDDFSKIYQCKGWPYSGYCGDETYSPLNNQKGCNGAVCWPTAWTYIGGCSGTIAPTGSPVFTTIEKWDKEGCPDEYVANNPNYKGGDHVSISKNEDNTYGIVWKCKEGTTEPWCRSEGYAPGTQYGGQAWEKVGHCEGTMSPTTAPIPFPDACQFKYNLETTDGGEYVILPVGSWVKGGSTISTGGTALDLSPYKPGQLVRYGGDARKCKGFPYTGFCPAWSPFIQDSPDFNPIYSPKGWEEATCEQVGASADHKDDEYEASEDGPVFDSNGKVLVNKAGVCQTGVNVDAVLASDSQAINPEDYFKASPAVKGCQKCDSGKGLDSDGTPKVCTQCLDGAEDEIVDRKSVCVCTNGASDPWADLADHCKSCPSGKKYLGNDTTNALGDATCETCPSGFVYTTLTNGSSVDYKLCCKDSDCADDGTANTLDECYDGTTAKTHCAAAGLSA